MHKENRRQKTTRKHRNRGRKQAIAMLLCLAVFCSTYALLLPVAASQQNYLCGMEAHVHAETCYTETVVTELTCTLEEQEAHTHEGGCYAMRDHLHSNECFNELHMLDCGILSTDKENVPVCAKPERIEHTHGEECYDEEGTLLCELPEFVSHKHSSECYGSNAQTTLSCLLEEHSHSEACMGEVPEGEPPEGEPPEGEPLEGEPLEGEPLEGEPLEGEPPEGEPLEGEPLEGEPTEGEPLEGELLEEEPPEGEPTEDELEPVIGDGVQQEQADEPAPPMMMAAAPNSYGQVRSDLPTAVTTGTVNVEALRFYNLCEGGSGVAPLAGCVFEVTGPDGYRITVTSGNTPEVMLPQDMPNGTYTITEISVPAGHMRDTEYQRTFVVNNGKFDHNDNIGTFINHDLRVLNNIKTAEVENYNNRIYQVLMEAENHMRMYEMDPIDVLFVVDQSNSMLFPSGLTSTGHTVKLHKDGSWYGGNNGQTMENLGLDKDKAYYIISDPQGTSTVWIIYWDDQLGQWMYQDASYYAKAKHNNRVGYQDPTEQAVFPGDHAFSKEVTNGQKSNGGALNKSMNGSSLYNHIGSDNDGDAYASYFTLYVASDAYNRLHYLEESMTNMIYELANANDRNRVTLIGFTRELKMDVGPYTLTPDNTEYLVSLVNSINTGGGTRQDVGLKQAYEGHLNNPGQGFNRGVDYTHTILITDGAPVRSGSDAPPLGSPNSQATTNAGGEIYGQIKGWANQVKTKSNLMTVGLGMRDVAGGHQVLNEIASSGHFCALDDASQLVHEMQKLLFDNFRAKEPIFLYGDIVDEISDSFYPIAWVPAGQAAATGRMVLELQNEPETNAVFDSSRQWILLEAGDWINLEGGYTTVGASDAAGQLLRKADGTFYIQWINANISDVHAADNERVAWVTKGSGAGTGRQVIATDDTRDWILLHESDWISPNGQYQPGGRQQNYGQIRKDGDRWYVAWSNNGNGSGRAYYDFPGWDATFYLKAKEDFIGGNAIDTNKNAYITVNDGKGTSGSRTFAKPTVNVRLLGLDERNSEVTVYLGDIINANDDRPLDSLMHFWHQLAFTKLVAGEGDVLNKTAGTNEHLTAEKFTLEYALGEHLPDGVWDSMLQGHAVTMEYTYDDASSHGPVGYFTFSLEKIGETSDYGTHVATEACQPGGTPLTEDCDDPVETYILNVTYTAYKLGEHGRAAANANNGSGSPGTEVGTGATLPTGLGVVKSRNVHEVHVISGVIEVTKIMEPGMEPETDKTFSFTLHRKEDGNHDNDVTKTVTIPAGSGGPVTITFDGLRRGTYTVTEAEDDEYMLRRIKVLETTNCESTPTIGETAQTVTFVMGNNPSKANVIGEAKETDRYTSYIDPINGVYGAAEFVNTEITYVGEIPVKKVWDDGAEKHNGDDVYLILFLDGEPVLNEEGYHRVILLNSKNNWTGSFAVPLKDKNDTVSNYNYSVREASDTSGIYRSGWYKAVRENDGIKGYYEAPMNEGDKILFGLAQYNVLYPGKDEDGVWVVENQRTYELPETGGSGTQMYTFGGMLLIAVAGVSQCMLWHKRRKRGGETFQNE